MDEGTSNKSNKSEFREKGGAPAWSFTGDGTLRGAVTPRFPLPRKVFLDRGAACAKPLERWFSSSSVRKS